MFDNVVIAMIQELYLTVVTVAKGQAVGSVHVCLKYALRPSNLMSVKAGMPRIATELLDTLKD
jgi:hypothetical protein